MSSNRRGKNQPCGKAHSPETPRMRWLDRLETRCHRLTFPGIFKNLVFIGAMVTIIAWLKPDAMEIIAFDRQKIFSGEVWRIFSFAFAPLGAMPLHAFGVMGLGAVFLYCATMIGILINDSLEGVWGETRTTLYLLTGFLGLIIGQLILNLPSFLMIAAGGYLYASMFLAFATLFPKYEFRIMFIIPVQVRWLGWLTFAGLMLSVFRYPPMILLVFPALLPYALWVLPDWARNRAGEARAATRRRRFDKDSISQDEAFHRCVVCGCTEKDGDSVEFRIYPDGKEYCDKCFPEEETTS